MAALFVAQSAPAALSAASTKTLILVDPGTPEIAIKEFGVGFDASVSGQGVRVELVRVTSLGSPSGTSVTPKEKNSSKQSSSATALSNLSAEPTTYEILKVFYVPPNSGELVIQNPLGNEEIGQNGSAEAIGIRVITPSGVTPNAVSYIEFEE